MPNTVSAFSNVCVDTTMVNERRDQGVPHDTSGARQFAMWALATLGVEVTPGNGSCLEFDVPEKYRGCFDSAARVVLASDGQAEADGSESGGASSLAPYATLITQLSACLQLHGTWAHAVPAVQPASVHRLALMMFSAYQVEQGAVSLAGCTLEDRPIIRFTFRNLGQSSSNGMAHVYLDAKGKLLDFSQVAVLGLDDVVPLRRRVPKLVDSQSQQMLAFADMQPEYAGEQWELLAKTLVWCKYASGKLALDIAGARAEIPFSGWAKPYAEGATKPPPYLCPVSGLKTYCVAATDRGKIVAQDAIVSCDQSGQKVVDEQLLTCPVTGRRALEDFFSVCPASGERVLTAAMAPCTMCQQRVSPRALKHQSCVACRSLRHVRKEDPRMARLLDEYPVLDGWRRWKMYETSRVYILTAAGFVERLLVVIDKQSLEAYRVATSSRFASGWADVSDLQREEILGKKG